MGACVLTAVLAVAGSGLVPVAPAAASTPPARVTAMRWAITQAGHWYCWGGTGPCYDCSGLVVRAYARAGIALPRTTYAMLASRHLRRIPLSRARRGDLVFYGRGHVELKSRWWHRTFGASHSGTRLGWHRWSAYFRPTAAYRVRR